MCAYLATKPASIGGVPKRSPGAPARKRKLSAEGTTPQQREVSHHAAPSAPRGLRLSRLFRLALEL